MERILVIRFSSIGDVILTTPVMRALREKFGGARIDVLVKKEFSEIFEGSPFVDGVIGFDSAKSGVLKLCKELNKNDYSIVIDLHRNIRSRLILLFVKAGRKLAYKKGAMKRRLLTAFKIRFKNMPHTVDRYLSALASLGIGSADPLPYISLSDDDLSFAKDLLVKGGMSDAAVRVAVCPGAKHRAKRYPAAKFANLIDMLIDDPGARVILIGSKADERQISDIMTGITNKECVLTLTDGTIKQSAAVIRECDILVTNDSAPMHLAVSVGTPLVALFGPTDKGFGFYPLGRDDIVLTKNYSCSPCSLHGKKECVKYDYRCLNDIAESEIINKVNYILRQGGGRENE